MTELNSNSTTDVKAFETAVLRALLAAHIQLYPVLLPYMRILMQLERKDRLKAVLFGSHQTGYIKATDKAIERWYTNTPMQKKWQSIRNHIPDIDTEIMFHMVYLFWGMTEVELDDVWLWLRLQA